MPKKLLLLLLIVSPFVIGFINNRLLMLIITTPIPLIFEFHFYVVPLLMLGYWFWVGGRFARMKIKAIPAIFLGNIVGIISVVLFVWQFMFVLEEDRSSMVALISQYVYIVMPRFIGRIAGLFEPVKNHYGIVTISVARFLGLVLMMIVFTAGYFFVKRKERLSENATS